MRFYNKTLKTAQETPKHQRLAPKKLLQIENEVASEKGF